MAVANLANRIQVNTNCGNNDALYGPYNNINEALKSIPSTLRNGADAVGRTIGVLENGKCVEYWWQPTGKDEYGFVKYGFVKKGVSVVIQEGNATILPNTLNVWEEEITSPVTIIKGDETEGIVNHYMIRFTAGEGGQIIFDNSTWGTLIWYGGEAPAWTVGNTYEISIVDNIALWAEIEPVTTA